MSFFAAVGRVTRTGLDRMIEARERQVRRYVNGALLHLDDKSLAEAGIDRKELEKRASAFSPF